MGSSPLNPRLLAAMKEVFGQVRVINPGEPLEGYYHGSPYKEGEQSLKIIRRGETYAASCCFCGDTRGRMAVNHRWGVFDPTTGHRGYNLWKCYNEECQHDFARRGRLIDILSNPKLYAAKLPCPTVEPVHAVDPKGLTPCEFPGLMIPLTELDSSHKAVKYLCRDRGFDRDELAKTWEIGYAESVPARSRGSMAQDRIICPVRQSGIMVGYQARYIGDVDWKELKIPKYLTYFPKSRALYGLDQSADSDVVVLMEGVSDVWRYGPGAVSPLGKSLSPEQAQLLAKNLNNRPLVMVPDSDDEKSFDAFCVMVETIRRADYTGPIGIAALPPGIDPAVLPRDRLRRIVGYAASRAF